MPEQRALTTFEGAADAFALLCPDAGPALAGSGGIDWHCEQCGALLLDGLYERQILDVLVRCYACGATGTTPRRAPGEPLAGRPLLLPPGPYRLSSQLRADGKPVMVVGVQALDGYVYETGLDQLAAGGLYPQQPTELSAHFVRTLASAASALLGERFDHLQAADARGRASPTPPTHRHRLIELIDQAVTVATALDQGGGVVDGNALSELSTYVALFHRWRHHPAHPHLLKTLADGTEVRHTLMVLGVASYLADAGNPVGIVFRPSGGRIPDLWVTPGLLERLNLEVKTPTELRGPRPAVLTRHEAETLLVRLLKKAAAAGSGQLDQRHAGVLALGGFHLGPSFEVLVDAAARVLAAQSSRKKHLAALLIMDLTYQTTRVLHPDARGERVTFQPMLRAELVRHPGYRGGLEFRGSEAPWTTTGGMQQPQG